MNDGDELNPDEMAETEEEAVRKVREKQLEDRVQQFKAEKRCAKSRMTKLLNHMAGIISDNKSEQTEIKNLLLAMEQQKEETLAIMEKLENLYRQKSDQQNALKVSDEADLLIEQVERETSTARMCLMSLAKSQVSGSVVSSQAKEMEERETAEKAREKAELEARARKEQLEAEVKKKREELQQQERQLRAAEEEEMKYSQGLETKSVSELLHASKDGESEEVDNESVMLQTPEVEVIQDALEEPKSQTAETTKNIDNVTMATRPHAQLERIRIPEFAGNKIEFQQWYAAFTSCVDLTSLTPQFKMLRLEACLTGEAGDTIKGLGYSAEAYEAAKARLIRKYGGSRRQVQSHLEQLKKLKPVEENNSKELEKFADMLERAVITLKENGRESDLESGTLHNIILEKIPARLLAQYYRWLKDKQYEDNLENLKDWVAEEAEYQIQAAEIKQGIMPESENKKDTSRRRRLFFGKDGGKKEQEPCSACSGNHPIWKCDMFKSQSVDDRWKIAKKERLCYRCLAKNHLGSSCLRSRPCNINGCRDSHHRFLHRQRRITQAPTSQESSSSAEKPSSNSISTMQTSTEKPSNAMEGDSERKIAFKTIADLDVAKIALRTIPIILKNGERKIHVNCLLDEGSDTTYVNEDIVEELGLKGEKKKIEIKVANNQTVSFMSNTIKIGVESMDGRVDTEITAKTSDKICGKMKAVDWVTMKQKWQHLRNIPFPKLAKGKQIDVLLGADCQELMYSMKEVVGGKDEPFARLCPLGWTAVGKIDKDDESKNHHTGFHHCFNILTDEATAANITNEYADLNTTLKRFWDIESIGVAPTKESMMTPEEKVAWEKVSKSVKFDGKHYEVAVPWREDRPNLPNNLPVAMQRLLSTERKLSKEKEVAVAYQQVFNEYLDKQYIRRVSKEEVKPSQEWFLPHFPVVRPERKSTKVRIVFDGSAPYEGKSLNTEALPGPKLQSNIFDILVKFRKETVALVGDVSQMYHQLVLQEEDRPLHRFLWRNLDPSKEPEVYEFTRFVFGGCYCPFCAQYVWQRHAQVHSVDYPLAANAVEKHCYMDDVMPSLKSVEIAKETRQQLSTMGDKADFHIRKWVSNRTEVLEDIPETDRASTIDLEKNQLPVTKTLGVTWAAQDDQFLFYYSAPNKDFSYTKRNVLKKTATLFDPLGFLSPFTMKAKLYLQQAWVEAVDWDGELPGQLKGSWEKWFEELPLLQEIKIPRCLKNDDPVSQSTLHTFTDASEKAYTAAVYVRHTYQDHTVTTRLVASKTRLAPLKALSIPRLELMGAIIGLRLTKQVSSALEIPMKDVTFWIDSMNVHHWIHGRSRDYKPFVSHRVGEIHEETSPDQWKYVPTELNPADFGTRGLDVGEMKDNQRWWHGPQFLKESQDMWPDQKLERRVSPDVSTEMKVPVRDQNQEQSLNFVTTVQEGKEKEVWRLDPTRYSQWYKVNACEKLELGWSLVRIRSWVHRFINNCRTTESERKHGELTDEELRQTEEIIIQEAQIEVYREEIDALKRQRRLPKKSTILPLTPIWMDGLLRSHTRLKYSRELSKEEKYPIILPKKHQVTMLIIKYHHEIERHEMGVNYTINHLRERFVVVHGREAVKKIVKDCLECKLKFRGKPATQQMAPLPAIRLEVTMKPFTNCAVDFAGPFLTVQGRGKVRSKRYLCLFICLQTHCVHLEMAWSLDTDGFLKALTRMVARRGWPRDMLSDNGTNFVGGSNEIRELVKQLDQDKILRMTSNNGIKWHWNPPLAPHFGGVFERMIRSAKRGINAVLGNADVKDEELLTVFTGVESLLNSRPLTSPSNDPKDEPVLTPNHFLIGNMGGELAPESVDTLPFDPRKRWRRIQDLIRQTWKRWLREYVTSIGSRQKWFHREENVKKDDIVLVIDPDTPRRQWKVGRIVAVYPGGDGLVRVVDVKVGDSIYRRAISRISQLEF